MKYSLEIEILMEERRRLIDYIKAKVTGDEDWHAVSDAANDIREVDCKINLYKKLEENAFISLF